MGFDVFINYRRADVAFGAAAVYELLAERFGKDRIFLDNQSMAPGDDYPDSLRWALESMRVLLVLIGPRWLDVDPVDGRPLIERDRDWVRWEIRRAVQRAVPIIPVLLDGAALPDSARLPADVRRFVHHQTLDVRNRHLGSDIERLSHRLTDLLPADAPRPDRLVPHQLPVDGGWLVGRAAELGRLDALRAAPHDGGPRLAVISGTAGVGKTGLAVWWAYRAAEAFPDGQLYVDLRGYGTDQPLTSAEALAKLLRALGVARPEELSGTDERAARYRTLLSERRVLVLLDNARSVAQVRPLLPGGGPCAVVVTSRHQLGGLAVHHAVEQVRLSPLSNAAAVALLQAVIGERVAAEPVAAAELATWCANLPLALRIAAERANARPMLLLSDIVTELVDESARLDVLDAGDPYSTIRTVFSWSYQGLDDRGCRAFRALGVHPGQTFDVSALAALAGMAPSEANAAVKSLTEACLVTELPAGRYAMHDLLRLYTREITDGDHVALARLFDHYLHTADRADRLLTPHRYRMPLDGDESAGAVMEDAPAARRWLDDERDNLVACCRIDIAEFDAHRWQLAFVLRGYFYLTKRLDDWLDTHTHALAACQRAGNHAAEGVTRNNLGMALVAVGRLDEAMSHYRWAEKLLVAASDQHGLSNSLANQASVLRRWGDYDAALLLQRRALAHYRRSGALRNVGITLRSMARVHVDAGHLADAVRCAGEAVDVALGLGQDLDIAQAFTVLGMAQHRAGEVTLAEIATRQAVEYGRRCGSRHEEARAAHHLGGLFAAAGRVTKARAWWDTALACYQELGSTEVDEVRRDLAALG